MVQFLEKHVMSVHLMNAITVEGTSERICNVI